MRLGLVTGEYPPMQGGGGDYTREIARALALLGTEVHVITREQCAGADPGHPDVQLHPVVPRWTFRALGQIRALAATLRLDLLNLQYQAAAYDLSAPIHFLPVLAGVKTVVTFHDLRIPYLFPKAGPLRGWAVTQLARSASGAIATDPADAAELRGRGVQRVTQIPIGSNIRPAPPAGYERGLWRERLGVLPQEFLLGYFGFLNPTKGADTLVGALSALQSRKARVRLALIGGQTGASDPAINASFHAEVAQLIKRYDVGHLILQSGFVSPPEVSAWLLACDAIVLPYRDGVSFRRGSFMAALAHGCPIITTHPAVPLPELQDGVNVRLVPPDSASAIVLAVTELLAAPEMRRRLGEGAARLSAQFSWPGIARQVLDFCISP